MLRNIVIGVGVFVVCAALYFYWSGAQLRNKQAFQVGVLFPLTGDAASYGVKGRHGVNMALDDFNRTMECGRTLNAVYEDSAAQPETGLASFQKLIASDHTPAVVGDIVSSVTLAVAPVANRSQTV